MSRLVKNFLDDDRGATAIEYALIASGITLAILVAVNTVGTDIGATLTRIVSNMP